MCSTAPNEACSEAGGRSEHKKVSKYSLGYTRPTNMRSTAPNEACSEAGAGLNTKTALDAIWGYTRPTNMLKK